MDIKHDIVEIIERVAEVADATRRKVRYLVFVGLAACGYLAWQLYSPESAVWWNVLKAILVSLPALLWLFIWSTLSQLKQAPSIVANLVQQENSLTNTLQSFNLSKPEGIKDVFNIIRAFRNNESLAIIFEAIGGVTLLVNPIFAALSVVTAGLLIILIITALIVLIF